MAKFYTKTRCIISSVIGILLSTIIGGMYYSDQIDTADTKEEIIRVEKHVADLLNILGEGSLKWSDIDSIGKKSGYYGQGYSRRNIYLSNYNREIAMARVKVETTKYSSHLNTIERSQKEYKIESDVIRIAVLIGIVSVLITIPFSLLIFYIVTILWYFILNRISELSQVSFTRRRVGNIFNQQNYTYHSQNNHTDIFQSFHIIPQWCSN